jgi:hypothetical protein
MGNPLDCYIKSNQHKGFYSSLVTFQGHLVSGRLTNGYLKPHERVPVLTNGYLKPHKWVPEASWTGTSGLINGHLKPHERVPLTVKTQRFQRGTACPTDRLDFLLTWKSRIFRFFERPRRRSPIKTPPTPVGPSPRKTKNQWPPVAPVEAAFNRLPAPYGWRFFFTAESLTFLARALYTRTEPSSSPALTWTRQ